MLVELISELVFENRWTVKFLQGSRPDYKGEVESRFRERGCSSHVIFHLLNVALLLSKSVRARFELWMEQADVERRKSGRRNRAGGWKRWREEGRTRHFNIDVNPRRFQSDATSRTSLAARWCHQLGGRKCVRTPPNRRCVNICARHW